MNNIFSKDKRIKTIFLFVQQKYSKNLSINHGWPHIIRDLYRAILIADNFKNVNYSILIPATLLHDIGYLIDNNVPHEIAGSDFAQKILPQYGFSNKESEIIAAVIKGHSKFETSSFSLEAQILFDADRLDRASPIGILLYYLDWWDKNDGTDIAEFFSQVADRLGKRTPKKDLHLPVSRLLCDNGFSRTASLAKELTEWFKKRSDAVITPNIFNDLIIKNE